MSTPRPKSKKGAAPLATDLGPAESLAHTIVAHRGDLRPSVVRIVNAGLSTAGTEHALALFERALTEPGDPNRDPRTAIEASRTVGA